MLKLLDVTFSLSRPPLRIHSARFAAQGCKLIRTQRNESAHPTTGVWVCVLNAACVSSWSHGLYFCFLLFLFAGSTGCVVCHFLHTPLYLRVLEPSLWTSAFVRLLSITVPSLHCMALSSSKVNGGWLSNVDDRFPLHAFLCLLTGTCIHFMSAEKL